MSATSAREVRVAHKHRSEFEDRIKGAPLTEKCSKCGKAICDEEYVVCWGWCDACLSASLEAYEEERRKHANESQQ
jgi:hypothetical protein